MKEQSGLTSTVEMVLRVIVRLLTLVGVLIAGYVLLPFIGFTFGIFILGTGVSLGVVVFVVIAAIFCLTVIRFVSSALAFSGLTLNTLAKLMPSSTSGRLSQFRKTFLNFCLLIFLLTAYWVASPLISLVPGIGVALNTALGIMVSAVVILFFWSIGGMVYREMDIAISEIIVKSEESRLVLGRVREKALKTIVYFLTLIGVIIVSYALIPLVGLSFNILVPAVGVSLGIIIFVVITGILSLIAVRLIANFASLIGITPDTLASLMPSLALAHKHGVLYRIFVNSCFLILALIIYWIVYQLIVLIHCVGAILAAASQVVVAAIVVVFFWDIGRTIYKKLEDITSKLQGIDDLSDVKYRKHLFKLVSNKVTKKLLNIYRISNIIFRF